MASPMVPSRLFRSRWSALLWAAGVVWTAYDVAVAERDAGPRPPVKAAATPDDVTGVAIDPADLAVLANAGR